MRSETLLDRAERLASKRYVDGDGDGDASMYVAGYMAGYIGMPHNPEMTFADKTAVTDYAVGLMDGADRFGEDAVEWGLAEPGEVIDINRDEGIIGYEIPDIPKEGS